MYLENSCALFNPSPPVKKKVRAEVHSTKEVAAAPNDLPFAKRKGLIPEG